MKSTNAGLLMTMVLAATATGSEDPGRSEVRREGDRATMTWPAAPGESGRLTLDLRPGSPLFERIEILEDASGRAATLAERVEPSTFVVVGSRENPPPIPPEMSVFNVFFDNPAKRPHRAFASTFGGKTLRVLSEGRRGSVAIGPIEVGPFRGELVITTYAGARLVHVEAVVSTLEDRTAYLYDAGLIGREPIGRSLAWVDTEGEIHREPVAPDAPDRSEAVRHRAIVAESGGGSLACFPPPHQYFFPRDDTDNLKTAWHGRGHRGLAPGFGIGIGQHETGGGNFSPWVNAPPGTEQRLGVFYLLSREPAEGAIREALRFTHGDRFPELPGRKVFTSHWHMAFTVEAMRQKAEGIRPLPIPELVEVFKGLGVDAVHAAEFHGDGHPGDPGPIRLPELAAMFEECRRLSDEKLLMIPGEEANLYLGPREPGRNPGHWLAMFPKPVYWTMKRGPGQPFVENDPTYGTVYHVGDTEDMFKLLNQEHGLAWTAHPRIKSSNFAPDIYRDEDFFRGDSWLGAAWKAMPADLSRPRLGERGLDLLDDMSNWGARKILLGEVDTFKLARSHEVYGHMNVNYVRLDRLPRFDEGWQPILDALRAGRFFVTTGEVLIESATIGGSEAGQALKVGKGDRPEVRVELSWTFPLRYAEVVSGDGRGVYRERIDLSDTPPFGRRTLTFRPELEGRTWARFEVWDVATDGAFTQPAWIDRED
ncbi:hypothetical protein P12x_005766 [Tundrisphaera lichenicola]|uniref:hypothetical protein n=1 Tax=Tundrisphaera lichenicola TaxID=2029860 RepID=UPI003EBF54D2